MFLSTSREYVPGHEPADHVTRGLEHTAEYHELRYRAASAFKFAGGLAFPPPTIGFAMATLGFIGVALQFLLYPWANGRFGLMRCFRWSLFLFPLAYFMAPYISLLPSTTAYPEPAAGFWIWTGIAVVLPLQVAARPLALPASVRFLVLYVMHVLTLRRSSSLITLPLTLQYSPPSTAWVRQIRPPSAPSALSWPAAGTAPGSSAASLAWRGG